MGRPSVPHCQDCPDAIKIDAPGGGYNIYCPHINPGIQAHIPWWDRGHTSPGDCPRRFTVRRWNRERWEFPLVRGEGKRRVS